MPQNQSTRPCSSNQQRGVLVGRPLQQYTPTTPSARHTSEPRMYWIGGQWAVESTAPPRLQPTLRRNEASSLAHHVESTPRSQAAAGSDRVIWVRPAQSPHSMENYTSRPLPHPYSRPASPPVHTYHRYQPYPPGTHSSTPIENSNRLPHPFEYDPQRPPALPDNVLSGRNEHRNPVNDGAGRKTLAEDHHHQDTTTISRSGNVKLSTRRHQAHLDSEKKRREAINTGIQAIRQVLPAATETDSKAVILEKTVQYIAHLEGRLQERENRGLRSERAGTKDTDWIKAEQE